MNKAIIIMGSKSDLPWCEKIVAALDKLGIESVLRVASAHKVPLKCYELIKEYEKEKSNRKSFTYWILDNSTPSTTIFHTPFSLYGGLDTTNVVLINANPTTKLSP